MYLTTIREITEQSYFAQLNTFSLPKNVMTIINQLSNSRIKYENLIKENFQALAPLPTDELSMAQYKVDQIKINMDIACNHLNECTKQCNVASYIYNNMVPFLLEKILAGYEQLGKDMPQNSGLQDEKIWEIDFKSILSKLTHLQTDFEMKSEAYKRLDSQFQALIKERTAYFASECDPLPHSFNAEENLKQCNDIELWRTSYATLRNEAYSKLESYLSLAHQSYMTFLDLQTQLNSELEKPRPDTKFQELYQEWQM